MNNKLNAAIVSEEWKFEIILIAAKYILKIFEQDYKYYNVPYVRIQLLYNCWSDISLILINACFY